MTWLVSFFSFVGDWFYHKVFVSLAFHPTRVTEQVAESKVNASRVKWQRLTLVTEDQVKVVAYLHYRKVNDKVVLFLHGNASYAEDRFFYLDDLANLGVDVLVLSYRGYGTSEGSPTEQGLYLDARASWDYLRKNEKFKDKEIYVYGESLGAAVAIDLMQNSRVAGAILVAPFNSGLSWARSKGLPDFLVKRTAGHFDSESKLSKLTADVPLLILHGCNDGVTASSLGRSLYVKWPSANKKFVELCPGGHNDLMQLHPIRFWQEIASFLGVASR